MSVRVKVFELTDMSQSLYKVEINEFHLILKNKSYNIHF